MPLSASPAAYGDCRALFDKAIDSERGIVVTLPSRGEAVRLMQRLNRFRRFDRVNNREIYKPGDPFYGISHYDVLEVRLRDKNVEIGKIAAKEYDVDEL